MSSKLPRILLVVPSASSFRVFLRELTEQGVLAGAEIAVATAADLPGVADDGWPQGVRRFPLPGFRQGGPMGLLRAAWVLRRLVREWKPDLVHAHFGAAALVCALARSTAARQWVASIQGLHGSMRCGGPGLIGRLECWSAMRLDHTWLVNESDRTFLLGQGVGAERVGLHRGFGCDLRRFDPERFPEERRREIRSRLGLGPDESVLIFVGRQAAFKGFATVVRAWVLARRQLPDLRLLLVGTPDPLHSNGLKAEERSLLAAPAVLNLGWRTDVDALWAVSDVCVFPSRREGMPVSLMEALAMGVPVITSDSRGCRDVVRHGIAGDVLTSERPADWAQACVSLLQDDARRAFYRNAAIADRGRFDRQLFINEQIALWRGFACRETLGRAVRAPRGNR